MVSKHILHVLAAAAVASAADPCTQKTFTINSQADISALSGCQTLKGNVAFGTQTDASLDLTGPLTIDGDVTLTNNPLVTSLKSSSVRSISGALHLQNLTGLSTLSFSSLTKVDQIEFVSLTALDVLTFTAGLQKAGSVVISDTALRSLDGLDVSSADTININNNHHLSTWTSTLGNLTTLLNLNANGLNMAVSFPELTWIANMTVSNVTKFSAPSLKTVNGSLRFDSNFFTDFSAPNLTSTTSGDISFVSNGVLTNITMPALTSIGGGFLIANNTALGKVNGFPKLKKVGGAINLRGNFTDIKFPALDDVKGAFDVVSTADVSDSCDAFKKLAPQSQGGGGQIQGKFTCESNNAKANSDTNPTSTDSADGSSSTGKGNGASGLSINGMSVLGLAAVAVVFQML